jgi:hypothetical protein
VNRTDVAVATLAWARTSAEETELRASLERLAALQLPVAIADAGTSESFSGFLAQLPGCDVRVPPQRGLVPQIQASLSAAAAFGTRFILYTEPDKESFFQHRVLKFIDSAPDDEGVGVVLASRSEASLRTYPPTQRYTEGVASQLCARLGGPGDYFYGPFLMNRTLLSALAELPDGIGWGWRPYAFAQAARRGLRVLHLVDDHPCPPDQRAEDDDERTHRLKQLSQNILGLIG